MRYKKDEHKTIVFPFFSCLVKTLLLVLLNRGLHLFLRYLHRMGTPAVEFMHRGRSYLLQAKYN